MPLGAFTVDTTFLQLGSFNSRVDTEVRKVESTMLGETDSILVTSRGWGMGIFETASISVVRNRVIRHLCL
jgi:hypothetical protein